MTKCFFIIFILFSASAFARAPSLLSSLNLLEAKSKKLTAQTCLVFLKEAKLEVLDSKLYDLNSKEVKKYGKKILDSAWHIRTNLNDKLSELAPCLNELKEYIYNSRYFEDMLSVRFFDITSALPYEVKFANDPSPIFDNKFHKGYLYRKGFEPGQKFQFKSGDVLLEKGPSFISSIISTITLPKSQFSHFAVLHRDSKSDKVISLESYIQSGGLDLFEIESALKKYNVRIVLVRPKDQKLAEKATELIREKVVSEKEGKAEKSKYDYFFNFTDESKMNCAKLLLWSYKKASDGQIILPQSPSVLDKSIEKIITIVGIKPGPVLTPVDIEVDPRFEVLLEFRDLRLVRDSKYRDAIFIALFDWFINKKYNLVLLPKKINMQAAMAPMRMSNLPNPKNAQGLIDIPEIFLRPVYQINSVANLIYKKLYLKDKAFEKKNAWPMSLDDLLKALEEIRIEDQKAYEQEDPFAFHHLFKS